MSLLSSIRTTEVNGKVLYMAGDVGKALGLRNVRMINPMCEKVLSHIMTKTGSREGWFFTLTGIKQILLTTRKPNAIQLAQELNIQLINTKAVPIETSTIQCIMQTFQKHDMVDQYNINGKRVDLYFPKYKIAVECDEMHHSKNNNQVEDNLREIMIKACLDCTFIRYRPYDKDFNMFHVIGVIHDAILEKQASWTSESRVLN